MIGDRSALALCEADFADRWFRAARVAYCTPKLVLRIFSANRAINLPLTTSAQPLAYAVAPEPSWPVSDREVARRTPGGLLPIVVDPSSAVIAAICRQLMGKIKARRRTERAFAGKSLDRALVPKSEIEADHGNG